MPRTYPLVGRTHRASSCELRWQKRFARYQFFNSFFGVHTGDSPPCPSLEFSHHVMYFCNVMLVIVSGWNKTRCKNCSVVAAVCCKWMLPWKFCHQIMVFYSCCAINCENNEINRPDLIFFHFPSYSSERFVRITPPNHILLYCTVTDNSSGSLYNTVLRNLILSQRCSRRYMSFGTVS